MAEKFKTDSALKDAILSGAKFDGLCESFPEFKRLTADFLKRNIHLCGRVSQME